MFLYTLNKSSQILHYDKILEYTDSINSQYVIFQKSGIVVNTHWSDQSTKAKLTEYTIWYEYITYLSYKNLEKLTHTVTDIEFKGSPSEKTCEGCMTERQHCYISRILS